MYEHRYADQIKFVLYVPHVIRKIISMLQDDVYL